MRKEIYNKTEIEKIIKKALICRIAMCENDNPYVVPVCFGYKNGFLYIHSAPKGKKIEILKKNNKVCFEMDIIEKVIPSDIACKWSMKYQSVIGFEEAFFIKDEREKREALKCILKHYSNKFFPISEEEIQKVTVIKIKIKDLTCKKSNEY